MPLLVESALMKRVLQLKNRFLFAVFTTTMQLYQQRRNICFISCYDDTKKYVSSACINVPSPITTVMLSSQTLFTDSIYSMCTRNTMNYCKESINLRAKLNLVQDT
jgi:hypothetical protein